MKKQQIKIVSGLKNQSKEYYQTYGFLPNQLAFVFNDVTVHSKQRFKNNGIQLNK